jgi:hypothetical protein
VPITTAWQSPTVISNYVQYDTAQTKLKNNISGVVSDIDKIIINGSIGKTATEDFVLPTNTTTAVNGTTLAILDATATPKTTQWIVPTTINSYMSYNGTSFKMSTNVSGTPTIITNLILDGTIGISGQAFKLPNNTSTTVNGQILSILNATSKTTQWITPPPSITDYMQYNTSTFNMSTNVSGTPTIITDIVVGNTVGSTKLQAFKLPVNTTTASIGDVLRILNNASVPITTEWANTSTVLPAYVSYNTTTTELSNNPLFGGPSVITNLRLTTIGKAGNNFNLPSGTAVATPYSRLVMIDNVTRDTLWYPSNGNVGYITATKVLTTENSAGALPEITEIAVTKIGSTNAQLFSLPTNTSTSPATYILNILNGTTKTTSWIPLTTTTTYSNTTPQTQATTTQRLITQTASLDPGTYSITYSIEIQNTTGTTKIVSYINYGIFTGSGSSLATNVFGLTNGNYTTFTIPATITTQLPRYSGSGIVVLTTATILYLKFFSVYTGTSYTVTGQMNVTKIG